MHLHRPQKNDFTRKNIDKLIFLYTKNKINKIQKYVFTQKYKI